MALLGPTELTEQRQELARSGIQINYDKPKINAALQAVEDVLTSNTLKVQLSSAIDTAMAPLTLTGPQKREVVKAVLRRLLERWG